MIADYDDDTHFCLKCHATILGLDNYVTHRKDGCNKNLNEPPKSPLPSQLLPPDEIGLKADDFFSSLELRSSSKKTVKQSSTGKSITGILTRSKTTAVIQATSNRDHSEPQHSKSGKNVWIGGHQLKELGHGDNQSRLIKAVDNLERRKEEPHRIDVYEDSDEESEEYDYDEEDTSEEDQDVPPRNYTGGKWKPSSPIQWLRENRGWVTPPPSFTGGKWKPSKRVSSPPPSHTKGKWKPKIECEEDFPPPNHTKGKWKPRGCLEDDVPPPTHTKGKWKPKCEDEILRANQSKSKERNELNIPPPDHTQGKWKPKQLNEDEFPEICSEAVDSSLKIASSRTSKTPNNIPKIINTDADPTTEWVVPNPVRTVKITNDSPLRKSNGTVQYWCSPCNRRLASKVVYERHLKSDLHFKRTSHEGEFDNGANITKIKSKTPFIDEPNRKKIKTDGKRRRKKIYERCDVCQAKVNKYLMGKHLISHYHCRKGDISSETAKKMVLDNISSIVLQSPFQCSLCKFYCNTHEDFLRHWTSVYHKTNNVSFPGSFLCSFCNYETTDSDTMQEHLLSEGHCEVVSVINRSVPVVIKKINRINCLTCGEAFALNIQLLNHCRRKKHDESNVKIFKEYCVCMDCKKTFLSDVALQRHRKNAHQDTYAFCSYCKLKFNSPSEAKAHRQSVEHKYATLEKRKGKKNLSRSCEYCEEVFANFLLLKEHLKNQHPEHQIRCPHCGTHFTVTQELTNHLRSKSCKFEENPDNTYRCEKCPFSSNSTSELIFHVALHDDPLLIYTFNSEGNSSGVKPVPKYKCPICEKLFPKSSLQAHIRLHTQERPFVCKICNASFARKNNLLFHVKNHEKKAVLKPKKDAKDQNVFLCSTCGASFKKRYILQQHMLVHNGKVCKCPHPGCLYTARRMSEIKEHFRIHCNEKDFHCELCDYKGKTKKQLRRHQTVHDEVKKYQCSHCPFTARTAAHVKRHIRLHTGAKPFSCPHCDYKCNNLENIRKHILSTTKHPGKCVYECKFCITGDQFGANFAKDFKAHLITTHPDVFTNNTDAASYVAGIYEVQDDNIYLKDMCEVDDESSINPPAVKIEEPNENNLRLKSIQDPVVVHSLVSEQTTKQTNTLDQMLPMFVIPKDDGGVDNPDSWNLVGRYDVEESGTLVPFQTDGEVLFQEHF